MTNNVDFDLIHLRPRSTGTALHREQLVLTTGTDGFIHRHDEGLYLGGTRVLSLHDVLVDGQEPTPLVLSQTHQNRWHGYYGFGTRRTQNGSLAASLSHRSELAKAHRLLELTVSRQLGRGLEEEIRLTNYAGETLDFQVKIRIDADFIDRANYLDSSSTRGRVQRTWIRHSEQTARLYLDYSGPSHSVDAYASSDLRFSAQLNVEINSASSIESCGDDAISFKVQLKPLESWDVKITAMPWASTLQPQPELWHEEDRGEEVFLRNATKFQMPPVQGLGPLVMKTLERAKREMATTRMRESTVNDMDEALSASWQASLLGHEKMTEALSATAQLQGRSMDSGAPSKLYPFVVSELWHWTGDKRLVEPYIEPALRSLNWLDQYGDVDGDGFYEELPLHQSGPLAASVPIATARAQAFAYVSKLHFAEALWWLDRRSEARKLFRDAKELKKRFNDRFWSEENEALAAALDEEKRPVSVSGSDPGHCIMSGIVDKSLVPHVVERMMEPDLFSGWGIRTLSSHDPAFNPYGPRSGAVWPMENGAFVFGMIRYGFIKEAKRLARAIFESCRLFEGHRPPRSISGHQRGESYPFPAVVAETGAKQASSALASIGVVQSLLGLYPYAPANLLVIDPQLPAWLPRFALRDLRVGQSTVSILFYRKPDGRSTFEVLGQDGPLHILRQPNPWSLSAGFGERIRDVFESLGSL